MKSKIEIILSIVLFVLLLIIIYILFKDDLNMYRLKKGANSLKDIVTLLNEGNYKYENNKLYDDFNNMLSDELKTDLEGTIIKDEYGGISFNLSNEKYCVYKNSLSDIKSKKGNCKYDNESPKTSLSQLNAQITVDVSDNSVIDSYLISTKDELDGEWIKVNSENYYKLVTNIKSQGKYFIWFRDKEGNYSKRQEFKIVCNDGEYNEISNSMIYCTGAKVKINNISYLVINDNSGEMTLFSLDNKVKMKHCDSKEINGGCYYDNDFNKIDYKWSKSLINKFLNNEFLEALPSEVKNNLVLKEICDDNAGLPGCDSNDGCGGYLKTSIEKYKWKCNSYTNSKVRLITYEEFSILNDHFSDKSSLYGEYFGDYWTMNSNSLDGHSVSKISVNGEFYLDELSYNDLIVRPVFTIKKQ